MYAPTSFKGIVMSFKDIYKFESMSLNRVF